MGQYHKVINITKREYLDPHKLGNGLKQWEQFASYGVPQALYALLCTSNGRGGGDLGGLEYDPNTGEGVLGRWAGDDIRIVGDYCEPGDLPGNLRGEFIDWYQLAQDGVSYKGITLTDISEMLYPLFEKELGIRFTGNGWKSMEKVDGAEFSILA